MKVSAGGQLRVYFNDDWDDDDDWIMDSGAATVPLDTWTHVAATWGSTGAKLYINGVQVGSNPTTGSPPSGYGGEVAFRLGTEAGVTTLMDELRISNIQRTW
jgi:hypothetical protein